MFLIACPSLGGVWDDGPIEENSPKPLKYDNQESVNLQSPVNGEKIKPFICFSCFLIGGIAFVGMLTVPKANSNEALIIGGTLTGIGILTF